jgi:integrase
VRTREAALAEDQKLTIGAIMDLYIEDRELEGKNADKMRWQWVPMKPHFAHLQPADLETKIIVEKKPRTRCHKYALERSNAGIARYTINSELSLLRTAMAWGAKHKKTKQVVVWVSSPGRGRRTALTQDQLLKLLGAIVEAAPHIRLLLLIALATGARREAILDLTWARVDLERRTIDFNTYEERSILDTSHQKGRAVVDIGEGLYLALKAASEFATCDHVIEYRGKRVRQPKEGVKAVFEAAELKGRYLGIHALRHTLATSAAALGIDMRKIQQMLGHDDIKTTERVYVEFRAGALREVAAVADPAIKGVNDVLKGHMTQTRHIDRQPRRGRRSKQAT